MNPSANLLDFLQQYSGALQVLLLVFTLAYAHFQLGRAKLDRQHANVAAINERVFTHNALILADLDRCSVAATMQNLRVPEGLERSYWAARAVHLGHIHILSQVWELSGRPRPGRRLPIEFAGWQAFAAGMVAEPLSTAAARVASGESAPTPMDLAGSDLWRDLSTIDVTGHEFNAWLTRLVSDK